MIRVGMLFTRCMITVSLPSLRCGRIWGPEYELEDLSIT